MINSIMEDYQIGCADIAVTKRRVNKLNKLFKNKIPQCNAVNERQKYDTEESRRLKGETLWYLVKEYGNVVNDVHKTIDTTKNQFEMNEDEYILNIRAEDEDKGTWFWNELSNINESKLKRF